MHMTFWWVSAYFGIDNDHCLELKIQAAARPWRVPLQAQDRRDTKRTI